MLKTLHQAIVWGQIEWARELISSGNENPAAKDGDGMNALHVACRYGHLVFVKELVEYGIDIESRDVSGLTPIATACLFDHADVIRFLFQKGGDINSKDDENDAPLHHACHYGSINTVRLLLSYGADPNARGGIDGTLPAKRSSISSGNIAPRW